VNGYIKTPIGDIKRINTELIYKDIYHDCSARWRIKRNKFRIATGLYGIGNPDDKSPVLVTANYKLTFDKLRKELSGLNLWILVIDTKGINVWCAAGKGTFGTEEIIKKVTQMRLHELVSHRNLILPQLGAPGIAAHIVSKHTGFRIIYGPIKSLDIPNFISNGYRATKEMRQVTFGFKERLVLTPVELLLSLRYFPIIITVFTFLNFINGANSFNTIVIKSLYNSIPYLIALFIGAFLLPLLLPYIPFKSFSLKGLLLGLIWSFIFTRTRSVFLFDDSIVLILGNILLLTSITTFLGLNFTGSTTFTSFSGVQRETLITIPIVILASFIGLVLLFANAFI